MVGFREAIVGDENHGKTVIHQFIHDFLFTWSDAWRNEDGTACRHLEAACLLFMQASFILTMTNDRQQMAVKQGAVAVSIEDYHSACEKQAALDGREGIWSGLGGMAFALYEATKG